MTPKELNSKAAQLVDEARKIIKELQDAELLKDSYRVIFNAGLNGIEKRLNKKKWQGK